MTRKTYPTDLSDEEWSIIEPHVPAPKPGGRPAKHARREIVSWDVKPNRVRPSSIVKPSKRRKKGVERL